MAFQHTGEQERSVRAELDRDADGAGLLKRQLVRSFAGGYIDPHAQRDAQQNKAGEALDFSPNQSQR